MVRTVSFIRFRPCDPIGQRVADNILRTEQGSGFRHMGDACLQTVVKAAALRIRRIADEQQASVIMFYGDGTRDANRLIVHEDSCHVAYSTVAEQGEGIT